MGPDADPLAIQRETVAVGGSLRGITTSAKAAPLRVEGVRCRLNTFLAGALVIGDVVFLGMLCWFSLIAWILRDGLGPDSIRVSSGSEALVKFGSAVMWFVFHNSFSLALLLILSLGHLLHFLLQREKPQALNDASRELQDEAPANKQLN
jgi:hypothetical protein